VTASTRDNQMMAQMRHPRTLFSGFQMGSVAGHFSERAWSLAALPLPRVDAERQIVVNNLASFAGRGRWNAMRSMSSPSPRSSSRPWC